MASVHLNLSHVYTLTHLCREELIRNQGAIINVSSKVATTGQGQTSGYAAAKGAMNALTREWAIAFAPHHVRVNCVLPPNASHPNIRLGLIPSTTPPAPAPPSSNSSPSAIA